MTSKTFVGAVLPKSQRVSLQDLCKLDRVVHHRARTPEEKFGLWRAASIILGASEDIEVGHV